MSIFLLIASIILWVAAIATLPSRPLYSPGFSYLGLLGISFCNTNGLAWLPINNNMLYSWLAISIVVMMATVLQPAGLRMQKRGMAYMIGGAFVGLAIGLLGYTISSTIWMFYAIMVIAVAVGVFFGFMMYSNTPDGRAVRIGGGNFFRYLFAKGFPTAVTVMQIGLVLVLLVAASNLNSPQ